MQFDCGKTVLLFMKITEYNGLTESTRQNELSTLDNEQLCSFLY